MEDIIFGKYDLFYEIENITELMNFENKHPELFI